MTDKQKAIRILLEADTIAELMDLIDNLVGTHTIARATPVEPSATTVGAELELTGGPVPKRGRGRPPKTVAPDVAPDVSEDFPVDIPEETPAPAPVAPLTPKGARESGIAELQQHFVTNANSLSTTMPAVKHMMVKYGVAEFKDIPDERALEFYADVKLALAGNYVVPAA